MTSPSGASTPPKDPTTALDLVGTLASVAAVLVALVAVGAGLLIARGERRHSRLAERQRALVDLLAAFEAMQAFRAPQYDGEGGVITAADQLPVEFEEARARWRASLYGSAEPLPYTRRAAFSHFGAGPVPEGARQEGNPEVDAPDVMAVRGEIVDALDALRKGLG